MRDWRPGAGIHTLARVAKIVGEDLDLIEAIVRDMREKDGVIDICDVGDVSIIALTVDGIEALEFWIGEMRRGEYTPRQYDAD